MAPEPRTIVAAGTTISIVLSADDGPGAIATLDVAVSTLGEPHLLDFHCRPTVPPAGHQPCYFPVTAPAPVSEDDQLVIAAKATDTVGNISMPYAASFRLAPRPSATSMSPTIGPSRGGTEIVIEGSDFVPAITEGGSESRGTELLIGGQPVMTEWVTATEIRAVTPPHDAGFAKVSVVTGNAQSDLPTPFEFVAAPIVQVVEPPHGPVTGGTRIAVVGKHFRDPVTRFYVDNNIELEAVCFVSSNRVEATMPPGIGPGPVAILAYDEIGGTGLMQDAFTYDPAESPQPGLPDAGGAEPMLCPIGVP
jgi:hypothetical protein